MTPQGHSDQPAARSDSKAPGTSGGREPAGCLARVVRVLRVIWYGFSILIDLLYIFSR